MAATVTRQGDPAFQHGDPCPYLQEIAPEFRSIITDKCQRCATGMGDCFVVLMFKAAEEP